MKMKSKVILPALIGCVIATTAVYIVPIPLQGTLLVAGGFACGFLAAWLL